MREPPLFTIAGLSKRYGHRPVLRELTFDLFPRDFVLLLGNNGAGKTTLLKILSSLMRPSGGEIRFLDAPLQQSGNDFRRRIGAVFHESHFYGDLTARENLRLYGAMYGVPDIGRRIEASLAAFGLEDDPEIPVRGFSSGMVKRLAFARLKLYAPSVLLLDEPYTGLDQNSADLLDGFLKEFKRSGGLAVMVTHQFSRGVGFANRILILHRGSLVYNRDAEGITAGQCAQLLEEFAGIAAPPTQK